jgi:hypothetical protein
MKARPGLLFLLGLLMLFLVIKSLPRKSAGPSRGGRSGEAGLFQEEFGKKGGPGSASKPLEPPVIAMDFWGTEEVGESFAIGRNLFRYAPPKPVPPPPVAPGGRGSARGGLPPSSGTPTPPPSRLEPGEFVVEPPKPQPPPIPFKYLGSFGRPGRMLAVFADGAEIYDVFEGETFSDQFILRRINPDTETVDIAFVGFDDKSVQKLEVGP